MQADDAFGFMKDIIRDRANSSLIQRDTWVDALSVIGWVSRDGDVYRITTSGRKAMERHYKLPFGEITRCVKSGHDQRA